MLGNIFNEKWEIFALPLLNPSQNQESLFFSDQECAERGGKFNELYTSAKPFPHIVLDEFLPSAILERALQEFPEIKKRELCRSQELYKGACLPDELPPGAIFSRSMFYAFNSRPFLTFLEKISGIDGLIPDPYFLGGGFHETLCGGNLGIHADFNLHKKMRLKRRMNVLVYLNKNWDSSYGGALELWTRDMKQRAKAIEPIFNRCVIFNTDNTSYHGHPDPLKCPDDRTRKSMALYYYTASNAIFSEEKVETTVFRKRNNSTDRSDYWLRFKYVIRDCIPPIITRLILKIMGKTSV